MNWTCSASLRRTVVSADSAVCQRTSSSVGASVPRPAAHSSSFSPWPPPTSARSDSRGCGLRSWHVPQAGARGAKATWPLPAAVCGGRVPMQAQTPVSPHGAGRMKSSVQFTVGLVTGRGVDAPPAHPNLKPQVAALLQRVMQICCRGAAEATQGAEIQIPL